MKIKYVGLKIDGETAFAKECGIERWLPGDAREVADPQLAKRMLAHPDVFAEDDGPSKSQVKRVAEAPAAPPPADVAATTVSDSVDPAAISLSPGATVASSAAGETAPPAPSPAPAKKAATKTPAKKTAKGGKK